MPIAPKRSKLLFQKTERDLRTLCCGQQVSNVHNFRTTTRRLQTVLNEVVPERDRNQRKLLKMLDQIRKRAGKVRDLDVQLAALRTLKVPQEPRRKTQLMQTLVELRAKHENKLRKMLTKEAIREVRKRLRRAAKEVELQTSCDPLSVARKILAQPERAPGPLTEDLLHQYRIAVKRARYVAELAPTTAETALLIAQLKRLQDALGHWHDWMILTRSAAERFGDINQSSLVAGLDSVTRGKFRLAVAELSASSAVPFAVKPSATSPDAIARKLETKSSTLAESGSAA